MTSNDPTPDDAPIAGDDAIARAARDGLRRLAGSHAPTLDWDGVRVRARRVRQRRTAAVVAASAIVIASAGAAVATTDHKGDQVSIVGNGGTPTSTMTEPTTTTSTASTTTATPVTSVGSLPSASVPATPAVDAQPGDLTGTITMDTNTWTVGEPVNVRLTVRNSSDHAVLIPNAYVGIGLYISFDYGVQLNSPDNESPLAPGEERTFTAPMTPGADLIGTTRISAVFMHGIAMDVGSLVTATLPNIAPAEVTVVPPGWTPGRALDPAMGTWKVVMSADTREVALGDSVAVHATVTNVGTETQETDAYTSLGIVCGAPPAGGWGGNGQDVGAATVARGDTMTFTIDYLPFFEGTISCWTGITFPDSDGYTESHDGLVSDSVTINVLPEGATTTTARATTPTSAP